MAQQQEVQKKVKTLDVEASQIGIVLELRWPVLYCRKVLPSRKLLE